MINRLQKEISSLKSRLRRSDESDDLRLECENKTRQLEEKQAQFENLRKFFIHANNLDSKVRIHTAMSHISFVCEADRFGEFDFC